MAHVARSLAFPAAYRRGASAVRRCSLVRRIRAGEACRKYARCAAQCVDLQSAVIGQNPTAQVPRLLRGLERGVCRKRVAVFDDVNRIRNVGERDHAEAVRRKQFGQLRAFLAIARADN